MRGGVQPLLSGILSHLYPKDEKEHEGIEGVGPENYIERGGAMEISFIIPVYNGEKFIPVSYTHLSEIQEVYLLDDDYVNNKTQKRVSLTGEE